MARVTYKIVQSRLMEKYIDLAENSENHEGCEIMLETKLKLRTRTRG